ncbi:UbiA prenyltransferase [Caldithrix abyssi DSM 13497]|uniref:UbiA prenyltransferase n=2 Tax=Caldithrix abyssi DSM 13497 TaxID=880073 RepID=H1XQR2_CALAY|nr:geranylgeranylglycerol-phosphate geranylgeranyltransferase [Caldithrix abyssi]EHO42335.1 UbiA prenyltransferase [Caldithrix abyssi DSM 13497]
MEVVKYLKNYWQLSRPLNVSIAMITIWVAAFITPQFHLNYKLYFAAVIAGLMTAGANIINDLYDIDIDRINKPNRPLPSGRATQKEARVYFVLNYALSFALAAFCGLPMFMVTFLIGLLLVYYSSHLKRTVLWGNLAVSLASAIAFIYGAMSVGDWRAGIIPAAFAFFFHLGREIVKDMQDLEGDVQNQSITFPARFGLKPSIVLINFVFIFLIILTIIPYILKVYGEMYLWIVTIGVHSVLIFVSVFLWFRNDRAVLGKISHLLKLDMLVGLAAIYLGS